MTDEEFISKVNGDLLVCDDGFVNYWPSGPGYLTEYQLRLIADELKKRNAKWKAVFDEDHLPKLSDLMGLLEHDPIDIGG